MTGKNQDARSIPVIQSTEKFAHEGMEKIILIQAYQAEVKSFAADRQLFFFFQAEDGIRDHCVTGSDVCSSDLRAKHDRARDEATPEGPPPRRARRRDEDRKSGASGKRVDLGGRRNMKKTTR